MGEMTAANLAKYTAANPAPKPKAGRFSPDGQFFLCSTDEEVQKLEALGWGTNPLTFAAPYAPESATFRPHWGVIVFKALTIVPAVDMHDSRPVEDKRKRAKKA